MTWLVLGIAFVGALLWWCHAFSTQERLRAMICVWLAMPVVEVAIAVAQRYG